MISADRCGKNKAGSVLTVCGRSSIRKTCGSNIIASGIRTAEDMILRIRWISKICWLSVMGIVYSLVLKKRIGLVMRIGKMSH